MKNDFKTEVAQVGAFLGIGLEDAEITRIQNATSMDSLQKKWNEDKKLPSERFFRKGAVGEGERQFTQEMLDDLQRIREDGLSPYEYTMGKLVRQFSVFKKLCGLSK